MLSVLESALSIMAISSLKEEVVTYCTNLGVHTIMYLFLKLEHYRALLEIFFIEQHCGTKKVLQPPNVVIAR